MKTLTKLSLATIACLCLGISPPAANDGSGLQCIEFSPDLAGFNSMRTETSGLSSTSQEPLAGTSVYLLADVEFPEDPISGQPTFGANPQSVLIFKTVSGRFLVRIADVPPGHGWFGSF